MYSFVSNEDDDYFLIHESAAKMAGIPEKFVTIDARETGEYKLIIDYRAGASPAQKAMLHKHYDFLLDTIYSRRA